MPQPKTFPSIDKAREKSCPAKIPDKLEGSAPTRAGRIFNQVYIIYLTLIQKCIYIISISISCFFIYLISWELDWPNWPKSFDPHEKTAPLDDKKSEWRHPAATEIMSFGSPFGISVGVFIRFQEFLNHEYFGYIFHFVFWRK